MSRRLLIPLILFALASMGAECSGSGGSSSKAGSSANASIASSDKNEEGDGGSATPVPEPSAALVFGAGLLAAGIATRRKRQS
jgi:hypothetical protein